MNIYFIVGNAEINGMGRGGGNEINIMWDWLGGERVLFSYFISLVEGKVGTLTVHLLV